MKKITQNNFVQNKKSNIMDKKIAKTMILSIKIVIIVNSEKIKISNQAWNQRNLKEIYWGNQKIL